MDLLLQETINKFISKFVKLRLECFLIPLRQLNKIFIIFYLDNRKVLQLLYLFWFFSSKKLFNTILSIYISHDVPRSNPSENAKEKGVYAPVDIVLLFIGSFMRLLLSSTIVFRSPTTASFDSLASLLKMLFSSACSLTITGSSSDLYKLKARKAVPGPLSIVYFSS